MKSSCWLSVLLLAASAAPAVAQSMKEDFAWLDSLDLPDTKGLRIVRTETKEKVRSVGVWRGDLIDTERYPDYHYGFLLEDAEDEERYRLLSLDLSPLTLDKESLKPLADSSFDEYAGMLLEEDEVEKRRLGGRPYVSRPPFPNRSHYCIAAWLAQLHGEEDAAARLYDAAQKQPLQERPFFEPEAKRRHAEQTFRQSLEEEISRTLVSRAIERFGPPFSDDSGDSREELLATIEKLARKFPKSHEAPFLRRAVLILAQMIEEDENHVELTDVALSLLPVEKQVEELIYRLREEKGGQSSNGDCYVRSDALVELGYPAVPRLIEALDDERFTRGVRSSVMSYGAAYSGGRIVRVSDVAATALNAITREHFFGRYGMFPIGDSPREVAARAEGKAKALAWWKKFQDEGEQQLLVDAVKAGGEVAADKVDLLTKRYPDRAQQAIVDGLKKTTKDARARLALLENLAKIRNSETDAILLQEARAGVHLICRNFCAKHTFRHDRPAAVEALLLTWQQRERWLDDHGQPRDWNDFPNLLEILLSCDEPEVIRLIERDFKSLHVNLRYAVIKKLVPFRGLMGARKVSSQSRSYSKAFREAVDSLLQTGVRDDDVRWGLPLVRSPDGRVCDPAIVAIRNWKTGDFTDSRSKTFKGREADRLKALNLLEIQAGQAPTPQFDVLKTKRAASPNVISSIELCGELSDKEPPSWLKPLLDQKGKELDLETFCGVFYDGFADDASMVGKTLAVSAIRHADGTGIHLLADLFPNPRPQPQDYRFLTAHSVGSGHYISDPKYWKQHRDETRGGARREFAKPADKEIRVRLMVTKFQR